MDGVSSVCGRRRCVFIATAKRVRLGVLPVPVASIAGNEVALAAVGSKLYVVGGGVKNSQDALTIGKRALGLGFSSTIGIIHDGSGQLHDTPGVWIGDASAFPTAPGVNPMVSIMALAPRTAGGILAG